MLIKEFIAEAERLKKVYSQDKAISTALNKVVELLNKKPTSIETLQDFEAYVESVGGMYEFTENRSYLEGTGIAFHANLDEVNYNSYGDEDSKLERIYKTEGGKYFKIYGTRCSYQGTEWDGIQEVQSKTKTIEVYE